MALVRMMGWLVVGLIDTVPIYDGSDVNLEFTTPNTITSIDT